MAIKKTSKLKDRKILITAGPTWVNIDKVRVLSNTASGVTGMLLSGALAAKKSKVTLLLGPVGDFNIEKNIKLLRFKTFDELKKTLVRELSLRSYDIVIHTAAVSDYRPQRIYSGKVASGIKGWKINLMPTEKIISLIKPIDESLFLVGFKFEPEAQKAKLISKSRKLFRAGACDLVVANTVKKGCYAAYILKSDKASGPMFSKKELVKKLVAVL
ncbi:MAG TPA: hypothetical protein ENH41_04675 [Candidatus Omnitrophica bacterium]|nr:hypothetical protein [Candidatus Omnitrophota bacterium]